VTASTTKESVLVTGGAGFIGSHVVERLLTRRASRVTVLDNFDDYYDEKLKRANIGAFVNHPDVTLVEGDLLDAPLCESLFARSGFRTVVHLAARAGVRPSLAAPLLYQRVNVEGTYRLLELSRAYGVERFVFASSSSVYGVRSKAPFREDDPVLAPASPYAATKLAGEAACHAYSHVHGLRCVCLRFFTVYGPRQRPDLAIRKFGELIADGKPVPMFGDGSAARDYTYIDDVVTGVLAAVSYSASPFEIINLGNERPVLLRELIAELGSALGAIPKVERFPEQPGDVPLTCADPTKARALLGFEAAIPFEEGIRRTVAALLASRRAAGE
jgi:UDP-glucuronate 4-epimerase